MMWCWLGSEIVIGNSERTHQVRNAARGVHSPHSFPISAWSKFARSYIPIFWNSQKEIIVEENIDSIEENDEPFTLPMPQRDGQKAEIRVGKTTIIVGANGAGKTRLGAWIESYYSISHRVHRISAQKTLNFSEQIQIVPLNQAYNELLYGNGRSSFNVDVRERHRWSGNPAIHQLNDYDKVLSLILSEECEISSKYRSLSYSLGKQLPPPETKLDTIRKLWEELIPHRELRFERMSLETYIRDSDTKYQAREMSDGERVIVYMIGQCLSAPGKGIIIVDEPELHLHNSIRSKLWKGIASLRPDCQFVFLTHDLEFAASFEDATKLYIKSYDGKHWDWMKLARRDDLPEGILLDLLGTRQNVIFIEGVNGGDDFLIYSRLFPSARIIPLGSCSRVVEAVKGFGGNFHLHHLQAFGIIDRDRRTAEEIATLEDQNIFALKVAEIEHLYCVPEVIEIMTARMQLDNSHTQQKVTDFIVRKFKSEFETQVSLHVVDKLRQIFSRLIIEKTQDEIGLTREVERVVGSVSVGTMYKEHAAAFQAVVDSGDVRSLLSIYNRKSLSSIVAGELGLRNGELRNLVFRLLASDKKEEIRDALLSYFPARLVSAFERQ